MSCTLKMLRTEPNTKQQMPVSCVARDAEKDPISVLTEEPSLQGYCGAVGVTDGCGLESLPLICNPAVGARQRGRA